MEKEVEQNYAMAKSKVNFGFSINSDRQIDVDSNDKRIYQHVLNAEPSFGICIACGTCSATCTAGSYTYLNVRRIFTLIKRGVYDEAMEDIQKCMLCGKCSLVCPRGVNTRNLILAIQDALEKYKN